MILRYINLEIQGSQLDRQPGEPITWCKQPQEKPIPPIIPQTYNHTDVTLNSKYNLNKLIPKIVKLIGV
jgi:hypothetical protein